MSVPGSSSLHNRVLRSLVLGSVRPMQGDLGLQISVLGLYFLCQRLSLGQMTPKADDLRYKRNDVINGGCILIKWNSPILGACLVVTAFIAKKWPCVQLRTDDNDAGQGVL